jgi:hypothetical protein
MDRQLKIKWPKLLNGIARQLNPIHGEHRPTSATQVAGGRNLAQFPILWECRSRIGLGKLRPYAHWSFVPDGEHGSGTGDRWHGGKRRR